MHSSTTVADRVVPETADISLLAKPLSALPDYLAIEEVPLADRLRIDDFAKRIDLALAANDPDATALYFVPDGDVARAADETTFAQLRDRIARTAALLRSRGIGRGDAVAVLLPAVPHIYWAMIGAMSAGIVFPVNWMVEPSQLLHLLAQAHTKAVIALGPTPGFRIWESLLSIRSDLRADLPIWSVPGPGGTVLPDSDLTAQIVRHAPEPAKPRAGGDVAAYVHSGGTTGSPKIVKLSHRGLSYRHWTIQLGQRLSIAEVCIHDTPMFHAGGLIGRMWSSLASGASLVIPSVMGARDRTYVANYWRFVEKYRITRLSAVPTTLAVLCKAPPQGEDLSSLKPNFIVGSTALPLAVRSEFERISGVRVLNTYGMTENTSVVAIDPRDGPAKEGSSGIRVPYTQVRAANTDASGRARICGPSEIGMLQIKGPGVTPGYLDPIHEQGARTEDGWLISGDLGRVDEDGFVFVTGRAKDVIIRGGHNIDPALIEEPLMRSPDVLLTAAVGKPDAHAGELPIAYVQLVPGSNATPDDLQRFLEGKIGERAAIPKEIVILEKLPLTDVGKPQKNVLRQDAAERTLRTVLGETLRPAIPLDDISVSLRPHATLGSQAHVGIACASERRSEVAQRVEAAMRPFATPYVIDWASPSASTTS
ncbi:MAG: acyl-CoA synthetase [Methylobacteriaceae bacterium]|nr:acyl-CoA synthetase [Methylobacteriaceae bacterium]